MRSERRGVLRPLALATTLTALAVVGARPPAHAAGGGVSQVKHVVVLMQENRSADEMFGQLHNEGLPDFEAEPMTGNPDPLHPGSTILPFHTSQLCTTSDLDHSWTATHQAWNNGAMDGFTTINSSVAGKGDPLDPSGARAMSYLDERELPFYYDLYRTYASGDRYFASLLGPTFPNRFYLLAGTSFGHIRNDFNPNGPWPQKTVFDLLGAAGIDWRIYNSQFAFGQLFQYVNDHAAGHVFPIAQYFIDAKNGTLPPVAFVDPVFLGDETVENDEHPPKNIQLGQKLSYDVVTALQQSPDWTSSAMFFTYDEHGGFYDHVPPPAAVAPDNIPPMLTASDTPAAFDRLGVRVPALVVSPFAKAHFVSHVVHDHTSVLRFIETRFGLPALTARDAAADPMLEFFDFDHPPFMTPPTFKAPAVGSCSAQPTTSTTTTTPATTTTSALAAATNSTRATTAATTTVPARALGSQVSRTSFIA